MTIIADQQANTEAAETLATDLERLAAFVRANPDLGKKFAYTVDRFLICLTRVDNAREIMADYIRRALAAGATVDKEFSEKYSGVSLNFGTLQIHAYATREQVCERVVVGTREVEIEEPDPDAVAALPTVKRTQVVEDVEWQCHPILAAEQAAPVTS